MTLAELDRVDGPALLSLAVRFGTTRLIDNEPLGDRPRDAERCMVAGGRILLAYLVFYAALGAAYPYMPVFYRDLGLALDRDRHPDRGPGGRSCWSSAPVWGGLADRFPRSRVDPAAGGRRRHGRRRRSCTCRSASSRSSSARSCLFVGLAGIGADARCPDAGDPRLGRPQPVRPGPGVRLAGVRRRDAGRRRHARSLRVTVPVLGLHPDAWSLTVIVTATIPRRGTTVSVSLRRGMAAVLSVRGHAAVPRPGSSSSGRRSSGTNTFYSIQMVAIGGERRLDRAHLGDRRPGRGADSCTRSRASRSASAPSGCSSSGAIAFALRDRPGRLCHRAVAVAGHRAARGRRASRACSSAASPSCASRAPSGTGGTAQGILDERSGLATIVGSTLGGVIAAAIGIPGLFVHLRDRVGHRRRDHRGRRSSARRRPARTGPGTRSAPPG